MDKVQSNRQFAYPDCKGVIRMALYVSDSGKLFYGHYDEHARNRVKVKSAVIDENGAICATADSVTREAK